MSRGRGGRGEGVFGRTTMRALAVERPGGRQVPPPRELPCSAPRDGGAPVRVTAFGLKLPELFTRRGLSPTGRVHHLEADRSSGEAVAVVRCR